MTDKIKFTLSAVIPVYQYANLSPTIETEADTFEEARDKAMAQMKTIWDQVAEGGKTLPVSSKTANTTTLKSKVCAFTRTVVLMDEAKHTYQDVDGNVYLSGSTFANNYKGKFDARANSERSANKHGVSATDILAMWTTNAEASTSLGTAIHAALELYGKYLEVSRKTKDGTDEAALHKNPLLGKIVKEFYTGRENEVAMYEAFAVNKDKHLCGFIDRLLVVDAKKKIVRVQDYKTNPDINKKQTVLEPFKKVVDSSSLGVYWLQLSFYAYILTKAGYTVEGLDIFNYDGNEWVTYSHDVVDISAVI